MMDFFTRLYEILSEMDEEVEGCHDDDVDGAVASALVEYSDKIRKALEECQ